MGIRETLRWARTEWGIFAEGHTMTLADRARWLRQWGPFGLRTAGYGTISLVLGPITKERAASRWAARRWSRTCTNALDINIEVAGFEHVPSPPMVFCSNHQSLLDILVLGAVLPGDFKWAAKRSLMNIPFLGWHLRLAGHVPVDRRGGNAALGAAVDRFERVLRAGKSLLLFPEGTRSEDGEVGPFKGGGFIAAVRTNAVVVPVAIEGAHRIMGKHAVDSGPLESPIRTVRVRLGPPLLALAEGVYEERVADLRDRTHAAIKGMHEDLKRLAQV